jgi:hypothetical protein
MIRCPEIEVVTEQEGLFHLQEEGCVNLQEDGAMPLPKPVIVIYQVALLECGAALRPKSEMIQSLTKVLCAV